MASPLHLARHHPRCVSLINAHSFTSLINSLSSARFSQPHTLLRVRHLIAPRLASCRHEQHRKDIGMAANVNKPSRIRHASRAATLYHLVISERRLCGALSFCVAAIITEHRSRIVLHHSTHALQNAHNDRVSRIALPHCVRLRCKHLFALASRRAHSTSSACVYSSVLIVRRWHRS